MRCLVNTDIVGPSITPPIFVGFTEKSSRPTTLLCVDNKTTTQHTWLVSKGHKQPNESRVTVARPSKPVTLAIDAELWRLAKAEAALRSETLITLVESALRQYLSGVK